MASLITMILLTLSLIVSPKLASLILPSEAVSTSAIIAVGVWSLGFGLSLIGQGAAIGLHKQHFVGFWILARSIGILTLFFVIPLAGIESLEAVAVAASIELFVSMIGLLYVRGIFRDSGGLRDRYRPSVSDMRVLAANGVPGLLADLGVQGAIIAILSVLEYSHGASAVAGFVIAQRIFLMVVMLPQQSATAWLPVLVESYNTSGRVSRDILIRSAFWVLGLGGALTGFCLAFIPLFVKLSPTYFDDRGTLYLVVSFGMIGAFNSLLTTNLQAMGRLRTWAVVEISSAGVTVFSILAFNGVEGSLSGGLSFCAGLLARLILGSLGILLSQRQITK